MKSSDLLMVLAATALLNPFFFKNKVRTALASSFSAANKVGGTTFKLDETSVSESAAIVSKNKVTTEDKTAND